ncbi:MAG: hypothetical protein ABI579_03335 [Candidatus Sumerlaeota bacterium]
MKIKSLLKALSIAVLLAGTVAMPACRTKGPVEKAGEKVDDVVGDVKHDAKDAKENIKDAGHDIKDAAKDATN